MRSAKIREHLLKVNGKSIVCIVAVFPVTLAIIAQWILCTSLFFCLSLWNKDRYAGVDTDRCYLIVLRLILIIRCIFMMDNCGLAASLAETVTLILSDCVRFLIVSLFVLAFLIVYRFFVNFQSSSLQCCDAASWSLILTCKNPSSIWPVMCLMGR